MSNRSEFGYISWKYIQCFANCDEAMMLCVLLLCMTCQTKLRSFCWSSSINLNAIKQ